MNEATFRKYVPNASKAMIEANKGLLGESVVPQDQLPAVPKGNTKFEKKERTAASRADSQPAAVTGD